MFSWGKRFFELGFLTFEDLEMWYRHLFPHCILSDVQADISINKKLCDLPSGELYEVFSKDDKQVKYTLKIIKKADLPAAKMPCVVEAQ